MSNKSFFMVLAILLIGSSLALAAGQNGKALWPPAPRAEVCGVTDLPYGPAVDQVQISPQAGPEYVYWMEWHGTHTSVLKYIIKYPASAMVSKEVQVLKNGVSAQFTTPFAVTWGAAQAGTAVLKVKTDAGTCSYQFEIIGF